MATSIQIDDDCRQVTYLDAIRAALEDEMAADPRVLLLGEDIGVMGGAFRVTRGLWERYGDSRVIDTPIAEAAIVGCAIGLALEGLRPIVELQSADFISCAYDQLVSEAAKLHYRWGMAVPIVVRGPAGAGIGAGPFHSQSPEGVFAHVPGLKVVCPGTVQDAYDLLRAAVRDPNPVLFFEHKALYRRLRADLDRSERDWRLEGAAVRRRGCELTLVTYGGALDECLRVADELAGRGTSIDVVDLRCVAPLDIDTVLASVRQTHRIVIVHEDTLTCGVGAEVAARVSDGAFWQLDAPVLRVGALDAPVPFARGLEDEYLPNGRIREAVERCLSV